MPVVTGYSYKKSRRGWVRVELDDGSYVSLRRDVFGEEGYQTNEEVPWDRLRDAVLESETRHAKAVAYRFLSERPRTVKEMTDRLAKEDLGTKSIEAVVADLTRSGYLDDEQFARLWAESRANNRPRGRRAVSAELRKLGVARETIEHVLDSYYPDDGDLVRKVAVRRADSLRHLDRATFRRRLAGYLSRRGFDYATVAPLLDELWEESPDSEFD